MYDSLTLLPNRSAFYAWLERALDPPDLPAPIITVVFLDVDDFTSLNTTFGQQIGDVVLRTVAARLTAAIGYGDMVGRLSNDEFGCVMIGVPPPDQFQRITKALRAAISAPMAIGALDFTVHASIGIVSSAASGSSANSLMERAARDMYRAKLNGPGCAPFESRVRPHQ